MTTSNNTSLDPQILVEVENRIKTITIHNPKAKNAVSPEMTAQLRHAIAECYTDDTRVIILTGSGADFCSGAALSTNLDPRTFDVTQYLKDTANPVILGIRNCNIPVIAKARGVVMGLGANFALACDMIYATPDVVFSQIFTQIALSSDGGGAYFMPQILGHKKAFEFMATAAKITAQDALQYGMINHICSEEEIDQRVQDIAEKLANGPYVAIQNTKANIREGMTGSLESTLALEAENQAINFKTQDFIEGIQAFLQKRTPKFKGK